VSVLNVYSKIRNRQLRTLGIVLHAVGLFTVAGCVLAFHLLGSSVVAEQTGRNSLQTAGLERLLKTAGRTRERHERLAAELEALERDAENMRLRIPDRPEETEFLRQLTQVADEEHLRILNWERGRLDERPTHTEYEIRLVCEGKYPAICGFLDRLDHLPRVTSVQRMSVQATDESKEYPFDMTLKLYFGARASEAD
jgi:Tfp pilus assembly protein PilO